MIQQIYMQPLENEHVTNTLSAKFCQDIEILRKIAKPVNLISTDISTITRTLFDPALPPNAWIFLILEGFSRFSFFPREACLVTRRVSEVLGERWLRTDSQLSRDGFGNFRFNRHG
jgi:hypothetical protein